MKLGVSAVESAARVALTPALSHGRCMARRRNVVGGLGRGRTRVARGYSRSCFFFVENGVGAGAGCA